MAGRNGDDGSRDAPESRHGDAELYPRASGSDVKKLERDCLRLIDAIKELENERTPQSLRRIARRSGLSKDEVNRYLNPQVNEVYSYDRLVHVRSRNRPLYNWLIVSGPPHVEDEEWAGIRANTSKYPLFEAVCQRYGYECDPQGERGALVKLRYRGIENMALERMGRRFSTQEPVLQLDALG